MCRSASIFVFFFTINSLATVQAKADSAWGLGLQGSSISSKSSNDKEIDKTGTGFGGTIGHSWTVFEKTFLTLNFGLEMREVKGDSDRFSQTVKTQGSFLGSSIRWAWDGFEAGPRLAVTRGKSASLRASDLDSTQTIVSVGPELAYRWSLDMFDVLAFVAITSDLLVKDQTNTAITAGIQLWQNTSSTSPTNNP